MAQDQRSVYNAQKLECTICLSDFTEPKLLACLHTFCTTCLKRYCEEINEKEKPCPLCRTEFIVPEGGVEKLKTDQVKARLVLEKQTREGKPKHPKCDICENADAKAHCVECIKFFCSACADAHLLVTDNKLHKIDVMDENPSEEELQKMKSQFCITHADKEIELYCCDCEKLLCHTCHATEHNKHVCKVPAELAKSKCKEFDMDQYRVKKCMDDEIKKVCELKETSMTHIEEISKIEKMVEDSFVVMINHLEEQKSKLLNSLREKKEEKLKTVKSEEYVSELCCAELNSFLEYSRMLMERGTDYEILAISNDLLKRAEYLFQSQKERNSRKLPTTNLELFAPLTYKLEEVKNTILKMDLKYEEPSQEIRQTKDWNRIVNSSNVERFTSRERGIFGLAIRNNEVYMTCFGTPLILGYSLQNLSRILREIRVPGLTSARGLVYNEYDSCLYASNEVSSHIYKIQTRKSSVTSWATNSREPHGLSISKHKNLLVSYYWRGQIDEYKGSGQLIRSIELSDDIWRITHSIELETGQFIVCQCDPLQRICLVNPSGKVIKAYGKAKGPRMQQINHPNSIELDQKGNILVTDSWNNRLRVLTSDLEHVADVNITDTEFKEPTVTCWDKENDRLLVTTRFNGFYVITPQQL